MTHWGVAGTGGVATAFVEALRDVEGAEVSVVGSRDTNRAQRFAHAYGIPMWCGYEQLWDAPFVDVVYIATPTSHHYRHALAALNAGKPVLVEKPFTVNAAQANILRVLADTRDLFLMEAMWPRFLPSWAELQRIVADGSIGEVRMIEASFGGRARYEPKARPFRNDLAGGALMDTGVYPIQFAHGILGAPDRIAATGWLTGSGVDSENAVSLAWPGGAVATLASAILTTMSSGAHVYGTEGMITIPGLHANPAGIDVHYPGRESVHVDCIPAAHRLAYQAMAVQACLGRGETESAVMPVSESCAIMGTLDRVREQIGLRFANEAEAL